MMGPYIRRRARGPNPATPGPAERFCSKSNGGIVVKVLLINYSCRIPRRPDPVGLHGGGGKSVQ